MRWAGLRLQIVLAVCGLMTLAFVPLFFAVASLTRVALREAEVDGARSIGVAVAEHAADLETPTSDALEKMIGKTRVVSLCVLDASRRPRACAGEPMSATAHGAIDVEVPRGDGVVVARVRAEQGADRAAPLVRLLAVYTTAFALALAFLVYVALTRLIVKPVEGLARATDRVASGARKIEAPQSGARELVELSQSVSAMTAVLIANEERLRKKVDELTEARAQVVRGERLASVGRLAAGMAHEIGNPITAIMGMQDLMIGGDVAESDHADYVVRMRKETERVHKILRDLLDFARPETADEIRSSDRAPALAKVEDVMRDVVALVRPQKTFRDVELTVEPSEVEARISPERLTQILLNLAMNAGDAISESKTKRVTMHARRDGKNVHITVEDSGPGVSADVAERLFLPFVTTKEVGQGTGLGLAVCRGLVEAAGGRIELDANYKDGARFIVTLPAA